MEERRDNPEIETEKIEVEEYNASFEPDEEPVLTADELQDSLLDDANLNNFQRFIAKLDDQKWNLYQRIAGVVLGVASCVALFWRGSSGQENAFSWSLVVAVVIAMLIPNIIEKQGLRRIPKTRTTLAITMGVCIVIYFLMVLLIPGFRM